MSDEESILDIDALFTDHEQLLPEAPEPEPIGEGVVISLDELHPFPGHPFRVMMDEAMQGLVESIKKNGVLNRIIIRPRREGGYEIIAGHRRTEASRIAGLTTIPADLRRDMDDDAAIIAMIETNLKQRPKLLPSERAMAYRMMRDTLAHQGVVIETEKGRQRHTKEEIADCYGESPRQVARFIRLTHLNLPLLELVDTGKLQMGVAVQTSYLDTEAQCWITDHYEHSGELPSASQVKELRKLYDDSALTQAAFDELMLREMPEKPAKSDFIARIREAHFPDMTAEDVQRKLIELIEADQRRKRLGL
ncbi:MAG: ParB/RepB/Spo0J family partition protein [Clostridia bacterium]